MMYKPMELVKAVQVINMAKRRGSEAPESMLDKQEVVKLSMPIKLIQKFKINVQGQVIVAGGTDLVTIQSGALDNLVKQKGIQSGATVENGISANKALG